MNFSNQIYPAYSYSCNYAPRNHNPLPYGYFFPNMQPSTVNNTVILDRLRQSKLKNAALRKRLDQERIRTAQQILQDNTRFAYSQLESIAEKLSDEQKSDREFSLEENIERLCKQTEAALSLLNNKSSKFNESANESKLSQKQNNQESYPKLAQIVEKIAMKEPIIPVSKNIQHPEQNQEHQNIDQKTSEPEALSSLCSSSFVNNSVDKNSGSCLFSDQLTYRTLDELLLWTDEDEKLLKEIESEKLNAQENEPADRTSANKEKDEEQQKKKAEIKRKLEMANVQSTNMKLPRWRLENMQNSTEDEVMNPLSVFRSTVRAVSFLVRIARIQYEKKLASKSEEEKDLQKMLCLCFDLSKKWLTKAAKSPLLSLLEESRLSFEPPPLRASWLKMTRASTIDSNMMKLRVRLKGIITALLEATESENNLLKPVLPLLKKIVSDGSYFPPKFLFQQERNVFEFTSLQATRNMIQYDMGKITSFERIELFLANFLVVRIMIPYILMQPWECGIGRQPRAQQVYNNLTIISSLVYIALRKLYPGLEPSNVVIRGKKKPGGQPSLDSLQDLEGKAETYDNNKISIAIYNMSMFLSEEEICNFLLNENYFDNVKKHLSEWILYLQQQLKHWMFMLVCLLYPEIEKLKESSIETNEDSKELAVSRAMLNDRKNTLITEQESAANKLDNNRKSISKEQLSTTSDVLPSIQQQRNRTRKSVAPAVFAVLAIPAATRKNKIEEKDEKRNEPEFISHKEETTINRKVSIATEKNLEIGLKTNEYSTVSSENYVPDSIAQNKSIEDHSSSIKVENENHSLVKEFDQNDNFSIDTTTSLADAATEKGYDNNKTLQDNFVSTDLKTFKETERPKDEMKKELHSSSSKDQITIESEIISTNTETKN